MSAARGPWATIRSFQGPLLVALAILVVGLLVSREDYLLQGSIAISFAIAATGLGLALGLAGEYLLGQLALFAASAYVTAVLTSNYEWSFWLAAGVGTAAATAIGLAMSLVALRISKFYFALVGFFLVSLIPNIVQLFEKQTGGSAGMVIYDSVNFFGKELETKGLFFLAGAALVLALLLVRNVRNSPLGIQMRRMRDSTAALSASGMQPWRVRVAVYVLSSILAGVGGAVFSHLGGFLQPTQFELTYTILLFAAVLVGGSTTLVGPTLGVVILYVVPRVVINVEGYSDMVYGGIVLLAVILFPGGIEDAYQGARRWVTAKVARRRGEEEELAALEAALDPDAAEEFVSPDKLVKEMLAMREGVDLGKSLRILGARKQYGGVLALDFEDEDSVTVAPGKVHLLLGPNGSGKTTLLNAMCGYAPLTQGSVKIGDSDVTSRSPARIAKLGISRSFQTPSLPDEVTPMELLTAALTYQESLSYVHWLLSDPLAWRVRRRAREHAARIADAAGLEDVADQPCSALTSGQRRIVDVLLALSRPSSIVLLDEPAAGLSQRERKQLGATIEALAAAGLSFLVVEHDLELAMQIADEVSVLAEGHLLTHGTPEDVTNHRGVREVLIGAEA